MSCRHQPIEVINGLREIQLHIDFIIEESKRHDVLEAVGYGSVCQCLKKQFACSDSFKVSLIKEFTSHRTTHIKEHNDGLFWLPGYDWLQILDVDCFLQVLSFASRHQQVEIHTFLLAGNDIENIVRSVDVLVFADIDSVLPLLVEQHQVDGRLVLDLQRLVDLQIGVFIRNHGLVLLD